MSKGISYEKTHKDYIKSKGEYPFKGSTEYFNQEEIELIKKYGIGLLVYVQVNYL